MNIIMIEGFLECENQVGSPAIIKVENRWLMTSPVLEYRKCAGGYVYIRTCNHIYCTR